MNGNPETVSSGIWKKAFIRQMGIVLLMVVVIAFIFQGVDELGVYRQVWYAYIALGFPIVFGFLLKKENERIWLFLFGSILLASLAICAVGIPLDKTLPAYHIYPYVLLMPLSFLTGGWIALKRKVLLRWPDMLALCCCALFSPVAFSYATNEVHGVYGRVLLFGLIGLAMRRSQQSFWLGFLLVAPSVIQSLVHVLTSDFRPFLIIYLQQCVVSVLAFMSGYYFSNLRKLVQVIALIGSLFLLCSTVQLFSLPFLRSLQWVENPASIQFKMPANLLTRDSTQADLTPLEGKVLYVDFWSKFCGPCIKEMPYLVEVAEHFNGNPNFQIVALDGEAWDSFRKFKTADKFHQHPIPMYYYPDTVLTHELDIEGLPVGLLVDREGIIRHRQLGFRVWEGPYLKRDLIAEVEKLLVE